MWIAFGVRGRPRAPRYQDSPALWWLYVVGLIVVLVTLVTITLALLWAALQNPGS